MVTAPGENNLPGPKVIQLWWATTGNMPSQGIVEVPGAWHHPSSHSSIFIHPQ